MKRMLFLLLTVVLLGVPSVQAGEVDFDLNLHVGSHPDPPIVIRDRPMFLAPAELGFQIAVGVPYDMFHVGGFYYVCRENRWFRGASYNGPWQGVGPRHLPPGLAKKRYTEIIRIRDAEYARYKKDKQRNNGKADASGKKKSRGNGQGNKGKGKKH